MNSLNPLDGNHFVISDNSEGKTIPIDYLNDDLDLDELSSPVTSASLHTKPSELMEIDHEQAGIKRDYLRLLEGSLPINELNSHPDKDTLIRKAVRRAFIEGNHTFLERLEQLEIRLDKLADQCFFDWSLRSKIIGDQLPLNFKEILIIFMRIGGNFCDENGQSALFLMINFNSRKYIIELLEAFKVAGANFAEVNEAGQNILHRVCEECALSETVIELLFPEGSKPLLDVNSIDAEGLTPLHYLLKSKFQSVPNIEKQFDLLISKGASVKKEEGFNTSAALLLLATNRFHDKPWRLNLFNHIFGYLLDWRETCQNDNPLWYYLLKNGKYHHILTMIERLPSYDLTNNEGKSLFNLLIMRFLAPHEESILLEYCDILLRKSRIFGEQVSDKRDCTTFTPLHNAIQYGLTKLAIRIIQHGASLNNSTYLHLAVRKSQPEIASELLAHGIKVNATDESGNTALHLAILYNEGEIAKMIMAKKPDLNSRDKEGRTVKELLVQRRMLSLYRSLFDLSIDELYDIYIAPYIPVGQDLSRDWLEINLTPCLNHLFLNSNLTDLRCMFLRLLDKHKTNNPELYDYLLSTIKGFCTWGCLIVRTGSIRHEKGMQLGYGASQLNFVEHQVTYAKQCFSVIEEALLLLKDKYLSFTEVYEMFAQHRHKLVPKNEKEPERFLTWRVKDKQGVSSKKDFNMGLVTNILKRYRGAIPLIKSVFQRAQSSFSHKNLGIVAPRLDREKEKTYNTTTTTGKLEKETQRTYKIVTGYSVHSDLAKLDHPIKLSELVFIKPSLDKLNKYKPHWKIIHTEAESLEILDKAMEPYHKKIFTFKEDLAQQEVLEHLTSTAMEASAVLFHYTPLSRGSAQCSLMWKLLGLMHHNLPSFPPRLQVGMIDVRAISQPIEDFVAESASLYDTANITPGPGWTFDRSCQEMLMPTK